jgi:hypothetical protein
MKKLIAAGLLSLAIGLGGAVSIASAQDMTIDSPIFDLLNDPGAHAVLAKDLPKLLAYDALDVFRQMSLREISRYLQAEIDDAKLHRVQADLAALRPAPTKQ